MAKALLPPGFADLLAPEAAKEAAIIAQFMTIAEVWGYQRVKPPLLEFEESLLSGPGAAMKRHTFRLLDPISHHMLGLRADMTPQIGRIAASRLRDKRRPLRLSYAGQVLRVGQEQLRPARQIGQMGVELIGSDELAADCEMLLLAFEALRELGLNDILIDLHLPWLLPRLMTEERSDLLAALDRKDRAEVIRLGGSKELVALLDCPAPAKEALGYLRRLSVPSDAMVELARLEELVDMAADSLSDISLTIDPTDRRLFEYHTSLGFTIYAKGMMGEFGRGGRYRNHAGESATGFSLYLDRLVDALVVSEIRRCLYLPAGVPYRFAKELRSQGWIVLRGLVPVADAKEEATLLHCTHYWMAGEILNVRQDGSNG